MEEFELKSIWEQGHSQQTISEQTLAKALKHESDDVLTKMQKRAKTEERLNYLGSAAFLFVLVFEQLWIWLLPGVAFVIVFHWYFNKLYRKLYHVDPSGDTLTYLLRLKSTMRSFFKLYTIGISFMALVGYVLGFFLGFSQGHEPEEQITWSVLAPALAFGILILTGIVYLIIRLWYGRPVRKIDELIQALQAE